MTHYFFLTGRERVSIGSLNASRAGETVLIRARVHTTRAQAKMVFLSFRQRIDTVQALLSVEPDKISKQMVKWVAGLEAESIVLVEGTVQKTDEEVKSTSVKDCEIIISKIFLISGIDSRLPFSFEDAARPESEYEKEDARYNKVLLETRLNNRVFDLRTQTNQSIFILQSAVCGLFRSFLDAKGFIEIHSPKLQGAATESGASVFKVDYFKGNAFLAQSPQLAKQMAIGADFERVYEIGPVFRAENANTHRHMTEFTGLDLEMTVEESYEEALELLDELLLHIFDGLITTYAREIEQIEKQFPADRFKWRTKEQGGTVKLKWWEGIELLKSAGVELDPFEDLNTENEKFLGKLVKDKFDTDYFILDKFPLAVRPFYTMPDAKDSRYSNSYDFFMRGEEILSGAQRVHDATLLEERMKEAQIPPESMKGYLDAFKMGMPPHAGGGVGLERVVMLFLKLNNIRRASLFPRDPKRLEP